MFLGLSPSVTALEQFSGSLRLSVCSRGRKGLLRGSGCCVLWPQHVPTFAGQLGARHTKAYGHHTRCPRLSRSAYSLGWGLPPELS